MSIQTSLQGWNREQWRGNKDSVALTGNTYIPELNANLPIEVCYRVINENVVKKTVELFQPSMPGMDYLMMPYIEGDSVSMFVGSQDGRQCDMKI
ncbi:MAG: hypothetical protein ACQEQ0_05660 [Bacteroidota bacterium]